MIDRSQSITRLRIRQKLCQNTNSPCTRYKALNSCVKKATEIIEDFRSSYVSPSGNLKTSSKFRMLVEAIVCGWVVPYKTKTEMP